MVAECSKCHKTDIPLEDLAFCKAKDGSWALRCRDCSRKLNEPWNEAGKLSWLGTYAGIYDSNVEQLLSSIKISKGQQPEKSSDNERRHQRHEVTFKGYIKRHEHEREDLVIIKDLSKGGLRFITNINFTIAEVMSIRITSSNKQERKFSDKIEIVRIIPQSDGKIEVGARFLTAETINETSKKKKDRHDLLLTLRYKNSNNTNTQTGAVIEIGKNSALLITPHEIAVDERFAIHVSGNSGVFAQKELSALAKVTKSEKIYQNNFETEVILSKTTIKKKSRLSPKLQ